jgi:hypothetical protein
MDPDAGAADTTGQNVDRVRVACQLWMTHQPSLPGKGVGEEEARM